VVVASNRGAYVACSSLVVCDESGHTKFPFSFVVLSWGELGRFVLSFPDFPLS